MLKKWLIEKGIKILLSCIVLGIGIWYVSHSIGGASLSYTSVDSFMKQITSNNELADTNGCFLCFYIGQLFNVIGDATESLWTGIVRHLWILMALGFGVFVIIHTIKFFQEQAASKDVKDLTDNTPKLDFNKWFEKVWKTGVRVMIAGALLGAVNWGGTSLLKLTTNIIVTPVIYLGTALSMVATGVISNASCPSDITTVDNVSSIIFQPFLCMMGNINTVMLAGAAGGFALMNYSWLGMGGGLFTWVAGLALVILFLVIGFDLVFQVLNIIFKLIFIIIFMPLMIAAAAFEEVWGLAKSAVNSSIKILIDSSVGVLKISLKVIMIYAVVFFATESFYPGAPVLPPLLKQITHENTNAGTEYVKNTFTECEQRASISGQIDKEVFVQCFNDKKSSHPEAFKFMEKGFDFFLFMLGTFFLYFWVISPKIDTLLNASKETKEQFNYGDWIKDVGKSVYNMPGKAFNAIRDKWKQG